MKNKFSKFFGLMALGFFKGSLLLAVPQVINIGNGSEPKDLDPTTATGVPEWNIMRNLYEGLVTKDSATLKILPGVAESWKISKDKKVYTFQLRKDAKWSNGEPVTAEDFRYSLTRLLQPATAAEYAAQGYYIKGGRDFNEGKTKDASTLGIKVLSPLSLEITLSEPIPFFLTLLCHHSMHPVYKATVEKNGLRWTRPENWVGNGPFKLDKWEMNKVVSLVPNPHYWNVKSIKLERANFIPANPETEEKMFRAKELQVTETMPLDRIDSWLADKSGQFHVAPYLGSYYYWFNLTRKPLDNKLVRQALSLAIDREKIVKFVTKAGQIPGQFFTPPGMAGYVPPKVLPTNLSKVAEAKKLLEQAGYPGGKGLPPIEILYNTQEGHKKIAQAIQQMWKENLGVQATLYNQEWKVYLDSQQTKNYMVSRAGWIADYGDPTTFLGMLHSKDGNNRAGYNNPAYDKIIEQTYREANAKKRLELFKQAEEILLEDLPFMPIYIYTRTYLLSPNVGGWVDNVEDFHPLKDVYLKG